MSADNGVHEDGSTHQAFTLKFVSLQRSSEIAVSSAVEVSPML